MEDLTVTTIQTNLYWEDVQKNLDHLDTKIDRIYGHTDVIVLPEMFTTGFTMNPKTHAEEHGGVGLKWMQQTAIKKNCAITGSIAVKENGKFHNRLYWVLPDGTYKSYDKRHLFKLANEHEEYTQGTSRLIVEYKGWKICPLVCYDLRFPVWSRNVKEDTYDILIYVANWPSARSYPWKQLLIARAIENQCYVIGVNRIGEDAQSLSHAGDSAIINPRGEKINETCEYEDRSETVKLSLSYLTDFRKTFPVGDDSDDFEIR